MTDRSCPLAGADAPALRPCRRGEYPVQRLALDRARCRRHSPSPTIRSAADVAELVREEFADRPQESMLVLLLDNANKVTSVVEVALGTITGVEVDTRLVVGAALAAGAPKLILVHSHPNGTVCPSAEDNLLTRRITAAAKTVGLELLDHLIVGPRGNHFSYSDSGRLPRA